MSQRKGSESQDERYERLYRESIGAEPDWKDIESSKAWLEERYPLLDDAAVGSPLFRYMKIRKVWRGRAPALLVSMLSFQEMMRYSGDTTHFIEFEPKQEKLYPDFGYGYPRQEYAPEPDAMNLESDVFGHRASASPKKMSLAGPSKKRDIGDASDEQSASSSFERRRTSPDTVGENSPISGPPKKRKRSIEDVEIAPPTTSPPKRQRTPPVSSGNMSPSSPFDPQERSTPTPSPRLDNIPTENRTRGGLPGPTPLHQEYEDQTTVVFRPNEIEGESSLQSGSQSEVIDRRRNPEATNPDDQPTPHLRDHEAALNGGSETQKSSKDRPVHSGPVLQDEDHIPVGEYLNDTIIESERPRDQTAPFIQNHSDRTEQTAISVVIPLLQHQRAANEDLPLGEATTQVPVIRQNRKRGRKAGTKGRKAPKSAPQLDRKKRKPPTKGRKNRQSKPERESQVYVESLRSGVGGRKHKKPSKYLMPS